MRVIALRLCLFIAALMIGTFACSNHASGNDVGRPGPQARVKLQIIGPRGLPLEKYNITQFHNRDGRDYSKNFKDGEAEGIPYGDYEVEIRDILAPEIAPARRRQYSIVSVMDPYVWKTFDASINSEPTPVGPDRITVHVEPVSGRPTWLKFVGLYSDVIRSAGVDRQGIATLTALPQGEYIVMIFIGADPPVVRRFTNHWSERDFVLSVR